MRWLNRWDGFSLAAFTLHFVIRLPLEDFKLVFSSSPECTQLKTVVTAGELHLHMVSYFVWKGHCSGATWHVSDLVFKPSVSAGWSGPLPSVSPHPAFCLLQPLHKTQTPPAHDSPKAAAFKCCCLAVTQCRSSDLLLTSSRPFSSAPCLSKAGMLTWFCWV